MAQQGYGFGSGPFRASQYDDRGAGQSDGLGVTTAHSEAFGRSQTYPDGSPLFATSSASYDPAAVGGNTSSLLNMHHQHPNGSSGFAASSTTLPHHQVHYASYSHASPHLSHSPQPYTHHHHHQQQPHAQPQAQPQQQPGVQHPQLGMQVPGDLSSSQPLGMHMGPSAYGVHHHPTSHAQGSVDAQRRSQNRAETEEPHTPRPPNAWILYRSQKFRELQQTRDSQSRSGAPEKPKSQAEISRIISHMWQNESAAVKHEFEALADEKKLAHQRMYPTYRYRPKKKGKSKSSTSAAQAGDPRQLSESYELKKRVYELGGSQQDHDAAEGSSSAGPSSERKGVEPQRMVASQGMPSFHDLGARDRKTNYADRREVATNYGRSALGNLASSEHLFSYPSSRMHPYGERASSRTAEVFGEASSAYASGHWPDSDALSGSSGSAYGDGTRNGAGYGGLGPARLGSTSLLGSNAMNGSSLLAVPSPQRSSAPSQHLHAPIDPLDSSGLTLNELANAGGSFRPNPLTNHPPPRFNASGFGESRSDTSASGLVVNPGSDGLPDSFDPHRRLQMP